MAPSVFADAFRRHVTPLLREIITIRAHFMGLGLYDFPDAYHDVMAVAARRGANFLPEEHWYALSDWVMSLLTECAADVEARRG